VAPVPLVPAASLPLVPAAPLPLAPGEPADEPLPAEPPASDEPAGGQSPLIAELPLELVELEELALPGGQFAAEPPLLLGELLLGELVLGEVVAEESEGELVEEPEGELIEPLDCAAAADESASSALAVAAASRLSFMCQDSFRTLWLEFARDACASRASSIEQGAFQRRGIEGAPLEPRGDELSAASTVRR
jgi:hypothetical protein